MGTFLHNDDSNDHTVDTQDTSHDDWDNGLHDEFGFEDTHGADTDSSFGGSVSSAQVSEDQGGGDADVAEEIVVGI